MDRMINVPDLSASDVRLFMGLPVWQCVRDDLNERLEHTNELMGMAPMEDIWVDQKDPDTGAVSTVISQIGIRRLQGASMELTFMLGLLDSYLVELEQIKEEKRNATTPS